MMDLIVECKPLVMIELGNYVGYSDILFGASVLSHGGKEYLDIKSNLEMTVPAGITIPFGAGRSPWSRLYCHWFQSTGSEPPGRCSWIIGKCSTSLTSGCSRN